jgi:hypothetical protein
MKRHSWSSLHVIPALLVAATATLLTSEAKADYLIVGKNTGTSTTPAVYRRTTSGTCSKTVLSVVGGFNYYFRGTDGPDVMMVHDAGANIAWCGYNIAPLAALNGKVLIVEGGQGRDVIWGGNGGGAARAYRIRAAGFGTGSDNDINYIAAGPADYVDGSVTQKNYIYLPSSTNAEAMGGIMNDVFCTSVTGVFYNPDVEEIYASQGLLDSRMGPAALVEQGVEVSGPSSNECDYTYAAVVLTIQEMLAL